MCNYFYGQIFTFIRKFGKKNDIIIQIQGDVYPHLFLYTMIYLSSMGGCYQQIMPPKRVLEHFSMFVYYEPASQLSGDIDSNVLDLVNSIQ